MNVWWSLLTVFPPPCPVSAWGRNDQFHLSKRSTKCGGWKRRSALGFLNRSSPWHREATDNSRSQVFFPQHQGAGHLGLNIGSSPSEAVRRCAELLEESKLKASLGWEIAGGTWEGTGGHFWATKPSWGWHDDRLKSDSWTSKFMEVSLWTFDLDGFSNQDS